MQLILFDPKSDWKAPSLSDLPDWVRWPFVSYDLETCDPNLKKLGPGAFRGDGFVAGYGFTLWDGNREMRSFYLPVAHAGGGNLPKENVERYITDQAQGYSGTLLGANLGYDLAWSWVNGILFPEIKWFRDVQIIEPLIDELPMSMALDAIAQRRKVPGKDETLLRSAADAYGLDPKRDLWKLHSKYVGRYCEQDTRSPIYIYQSQLADIKRLDIQKVVDLESQVTPVLLKSMARGTRIGQDKLGQIEEWATKQERSCLADIKHITGVEIPFGGVWVKGNVAPIFESLGISLDVAKVKKNGDFEFTIDQALFNSHADKPAVQLLARARKVNKLRTTFAASVRRYLCPDGRLRPNVKQIAVEGADGQEKGARYGRMSCVHPNIQQQPSRDEFAKDWRSIYLPDEGKKWACLDYSQIEPRWTTHFAAVTGMEGAAEAAQAYWDDPLIDNHSFMAKLTGLDRKYAKAIFLGLCYGEGGFKLCQTLGLPTAWKVIDLKTRESHVFESEVDALAFRFDCPHETRIFQCAGKEGQKILDTFDQRAPFIRKLARKAQDLAKRRGWIRTAGGRLLHFPELPDGSYDFVHKALNRLIQGTSADQVKLALVLIDRAFPDVPIHFPIHDEIDASVEDVTEAKSLAQIMRECMKALVPFRVDIEMGPNFGYIQEVA